MVVQMNKRKCITTKWQMRIKMKKDGSTDVL